MGERCRNREEEKAKKQKDCSECSVPSEKSGRRPEVQPGQKFESGQNIQSALNLGLLSQDINLGYRGMQVSVSTDHKDM